jgi:hypothetical protein
MKDASDSTPPLEYAPPDLAGATVPRAKITLLFSASVLLSGLLGNYCYTTFLGKSDDDAYAILTGINLFLTIYAFGAFAIICFLRAMRPSRPTRRVIQKTLLTGTAYGAFPAACFFFSDHGFDSHASAMGAFAFTWLIPPLLPLWLVRRLPPRPPS